MAGKGDKTVVHFVGAGSGAPDLITLRGKRYIEEADVIIYAGSLVNRELLSYASPGCEIHDSAKMYLEQIIAVIKDAEKKGKMTVRLHTGDPCLFGAIKEQMDMLAQEGIAFDVCPGVSSFCGAAASLQAEYTLPGVSQSVIITRMEGRTPVPEKEKLSQLAAHQATMVIFLSAGMSGQVKKELLLGGYGKETPCAIVYKATWEEEKIVRGILDDLPKMAEEAGITKTALIVVGWVLGDDYTLSRLYDKEFETQYRKAGGNDTR